MGAYKVKESGGMPQYEAGSDGKCFNIRQGVRGMHQYWYLLTTGDIVLVGDTGLCTPSVYSVPSFRVVGLFVQKI